MREDFLGRMTVVYCLQPLPWCNGNIFKRFPGMWRLYLEDESDRVGSSWCRRAPSTSRGGGCRRGELPGGEGPGGGGGRTGGEDPTGLVASLQHSPTPAPTVHHPRRVTLALDRTRRRRRTSRAFHLAPSPSNFCGCSDSPRASICRARRPRPRFAALTSRVDPLAERVGCPTAFVGEGGDAGTRRGEEAAAADAAARAQAATSRRKPRVVTAARRRAAAAARARSRGSGNRARRLGSAASTRPRVGRREEGERTSAATISIGERPTRPTRLTCASASACAKFASGFSRRKRTSGGRRAPTPPLRGRLSFDDGRVRVRLRRRRRLRSFPKEPSPSSATSADAADAVASPARTRVIAFASAGSSPKSSHTVLRPRYR